MLLRIAAVLALAAAVLPAERTTIRLPAGLRFSSPSGSRSIVFRCPPGGAPATGSELHLFLQHAPGLDTNRSFLSISLNYGILRSVRLDEDNQRPSELVVPLPAAQLKAVNELSLSIEQFAAPGMAADSVWTAIGPQSYLRLEYRAAPPDLAAVGPELDVLIPERVSTATLQATALLVARFANRLAPEPLEVRAVRSPRAATHLLLIAGTPVEQPGLRALAPAGSDGIASLSGRLLCVTGASAAAVLRAARGLSQPGVSGRMARFSSDPASHPLARREWKSFLPPRSRFTLADLSPNVARGFSAPDFSISLPLNATPDAVFLSYGLELDLSFAFDPAGYELNPELSVELNGTPLRRAKLHELSLRPQFSLTVPIPAPLLRTNNLLRIGARAAGWLLPDTQFYLPRDYRATLPDLALLQHHLYPFSLKPDLSDTVIVLPDTVTEGTFAALLELAAALGRLMPADIPAFQLRRVRELSSGDRAANHLMFLGAKSVAVQETVSPWNPEKCVLRLSPQAVAWAFSDAVLARLSGDTVYSGGRSTALAAQRMLHESSLLTHVQARLRANWMALPAILSLVSGILFVGLRLALAHYKRNGAR